MNRYFSTSPARSVHQGIIDKYIGDAIMDYWGRSSPSMTSRHS